MSDLLNLFQQNPILFAALCGLVSLLVGSFLNVVIYRLPVMMQKEWQRDVDAFIAQQDGESGNEQKNTACDNTSASEEPFNIVVPRSRCGHCGSMIKAWENIPVLSYLLLGGKCSNCKTKISLRYPAIELATALIAVLVAWQFQESPLKAMAAIGLCYALITLFWIDLDTYLLPDSITQPLIWAGLIVNAFGLFTDLQSALIGAIAGYLVLWLVFWGFKILTGKEGMGYGDFKLLAALGAWLGWQQLPAIIVLSSLVGAILGGLMIAFAKHEAAKPIAFGPYLALAGFIALLWGELINESYLSLL